MHDLTTIRRINRTPESVETELQRKHAQRVGYLSYPPGEAPELNEVKQMAESGRERRLLAGLRARVNDPLDPVSAEMARTIGPILERLIRSGDTEGLDHCSVCAEPLPPFAGVQVSGRLRCTSCVPR
jgi:hypothetical protein